MDSVMAVRSPRATPMVNGATARRPWARAWLITIRTVRPGISAMIVAAAEKAAQVWMVNGSPWMVHGLIPGRPVSRV